MPKFRNYQTNFSGGLLSEGMLGRLDLAQYENGCKDLDNWWPKVTGGMRRRPGSEFLKIVEDAHRVESFVFSETQTYLVLFTSDPLSSGDEIEIYDPLTGNLVDTLTDISLSETVIKELSITQKGDVMFYAHDNFIMQEIRRVNATTFTLSDFDWEGQVGNNAYPKKMPFIKFEGAEVTISVSAYAKGALCTVTASAAVFTDRHVNRAIRYRGKQIMITSVNVSQPNTQCLGTILEELDRGAVLQLTDGAPHDYVIDEIIVGRDSGIKAQVITTDNNSIAIAMIAGVFPPLSTEQVEGLTSGNIATIASNSNTNPPASADWDEEAFSPTLGFPSVIEFHSQRLWLGGSSSLPAHIFGSRVAAFFNFDVGDGFPADSIQAAISGKQINLITDIVSGRHLQIFTDKGEFYSPQSEDRPLVPETFDIIPQTRFGSKRSLEPKVFDESTIFVQSRGSAVREYIWQDKQRGYSADAISLIAEEFINDVQEVEVLYGGYDRPEQIAFFLNANGDIMWYHMARAETIRTWGRWTTQGQYKSLAVVQDKLYALVERTTNAGTEQFLERFELDATLDCMKYSTAASKSVWTSAHAELADQSLQVTVGVTAGDNDYYLGEQVATSGQIDLTPVAVTNIGVGLGFTQRLETMPIEVKDQNGVTGGMPKRLVSADIYIASTLAVQLNGNVVLTFMGEEDLTQRPTPRTGPQKFYLLGYSERPTLVVENAIPLACEVLSLGAEVEY